MQVQDTVLDGVKLIVPKVYGDDRGYFLESFNKKIFLDAGLPGEFIQDNHSFSTQDVLRGLHYQYPQWQGKLVRALHGQIFDVAVDVRRESDQFGQWYGAILSQDNKHQLYVPPGYAHGFCVMSDTVDVLYKCTALYSPSDEQSLIWNDPDVGIEWPVAQPILSDKDKVGLRLRDIETLNIGPAHAHSTVR
ncbi:MAG TPA: dTDP-4-dehydrorhamnose 3,5-epimerase [Acidiferrobacteraceae bacterium]|nr:dTDP-4-dehydrorhamnose 3,5-epimerase [Acidiferrobacteraceae bacterium]